MDNAIEKLEAQHEAGTPAEEKPSGGHTVLWVVIQIMCWSIVLGMNHTLTNQAVQVSASSELHRAH